MMLRIRSFVVLAVAAGSLSACKKKPEPAPTPVPPPMIPSTPPTETRPPTPPPTTPPPVDPSLEAAETARLIAAKKATLAQPIYFEYDMAEIRSEAQSILDQKVTILQANPGVRLRIVGHCDERGSDEYNLALGQRRSAAALAYLEGRGISRNRIDVISMGEERHAVMGEGEEAWSRNRRDEFEIVAGADQIRAR